MQNTASQITGFHADRTADFVTPALLPTGLEGWLRESRYRQHGNILIVTDFTSDAPTVISGSHNFSNAASRHNDENYLIIRGNNDVADAYGCELMRLYDHYRFSAMRLRRKEKRDTPRPPMLTPDDSWTNRYFKEGSLRMADRLRFAGEAL